VSTLIRQSAMRRLAIGVLLFAAAASVNGADAPRTTWEGLELTPVKGLDAVYLRPRAEIAAYKTVQLNPSRVEFAKLWEHHSKGFDHQPTAEDMARIKSKLAELLRETFAKELRDHKYAIVDSPLEDTLLVSASIVDLYINAPDVGGTGKVKSYTTGAGRMTLVLELRDAPTGQLLARVIDEREDASADGSMHWTNAATNEADARRIIQGWATRLRKGLDGLQNKASK
jgi:hypothetical protein